MVQAVRSLDNTVFKISGGGDGLMRVYIVTDDFYCGVDGYVCEQGFDIK